MQFLKILFWCLIAFIAAVFTMGNWKWVQIRLFGNLLVETNLPVLLLLTFLLGFLPTLLYNYAVRWRLQQRLASAERALAEVRAAAGPAPVTIAKAETNIPPASVPTAVPPGVA